MSPPPRSKPSALRTLPAQLAHNPRKGRVRNVTAASPRLTYVTAESVTASLNPTILCRSRLFRLWLTGADWQWSRWEASEIDGQTGEGEALGKAGSRLDIDLGPQAERVVGRGSRRGATRLAHRIRPRIPSFGRGADPGYD